MKGRKRTAQNDHSSHPPGPGQYKGKATLAGCSKSLSSKAAADESTGEVVSQPRIQATKYMER
jgi:hypothetical protein